MHFLYNRVQKIDKDLLVTVGTFLHKCFIQNKERNRKKRLRHKEVNMSILSPLLWPFELKQELLGWINP